MTHQPAAPTSLRDRYAAAIASYDHAVGHATNPAPGDHHHGQADAVMAVRDQELEQLRAEVAELEEKADGWRHQALLSSPAITEVLHVADLIENGAPWTASRADTAARVRAAVEPQEPAAAPAVPTQHIGNRVNAEDCPACSGTNPPYPFICPGETP